MPSPDEIFEIWHGLIANDFSETICQTFDLPNEDNYVYRAESFAMTMAQIKELIDSETLKYKYQAHGQQIEVSSADITAYTSIFSPTTDTYKALTSFSSNAKKSSPRETVSKYLESRRICPFKIPKAKGHLNPYLDLWAHSCQLTSFLGPLPDSSYGSPANAKRTHPILPVFYHHFGCVVPTYDALHILSLLTAEASGGVIDMASGNGYWTYMLRRMKLDVVAVDNMDSEYRTLWIPDTVKSDGVEYLKKNSGGKGKILLMVYMVTAGTFTKRVVQVYRGNIIVVVGTQNANRYTGFSDCTAEDWFEKEMPGWEMTCRIAMPSFAGKDEGLTVWKRK
ncbi:hypothetical protein LHYA1_G003828 [Lachnellula hyalina]|uniref:Uncharacterized protein n=1 Tax=Lachnellula hyalina TaxID=1316788 RepID=A0A8H8U045_9HELO|nr:uncharacterized protein LHYA1_G003828 [Lachnellula hyalina]TVY26995.1 hypothetical protein LHYA1_G003828 [Lachnellula hyalina]